MRNIKSKANMNQCIQAQFSSLSRYFILYFLFITVTYVIIWPVSTYAQAQNTNEILIQKSGFAVTNKDISKLGALEKLFQDGRSAFNNGDPETAAIIWREIAELGHANAQYELASMMLNGNVLKRDITTALELFKRAANQGHNKAQYNMGVAFAKGIGVQQNTGEAVVWWRTSALNGNTDAQFNLGLMYSNGYGVSKDMVVAAQWWQQAATQGDAAAQFNLGMLYASGEGVGQSWKIAINLWKRSAEQGFSHAVRALEVLAKNKN
ncbi:MAG: tetratricopeptide repeat protein [Acidiferrobacterales bacterium]